MKEAGVPERVNIVVPRACAYVTMGERRAAFKIIDRLAKDIQVLKKTVKLSWATIPGIKDNERLMDYWESERGIAQIPYNKLPERLDALLEGAYLDVDTLPAHLHGLYDAKGAKLQPLQQQQQLLPPPQLPIGGAGSLQQQQPPTQLQTMLQQPPPAILNPSSTAMASTPTSAGAVAQTIGFTPSGMAITQQVTRCTVDSPPHNLLLPL